MTVDVKWATLQPFKAERWLPGPLAQTPPRYAAGQDVDRVSRQSVAETIVSDFSAGILPSLDVRTYGQTFNRYRSNKHGIRLYYPQRALLPFVVKNQTAITNDVDISGYKAANKQAYSCMSAVGSASGEIYYTAFGTKLYRANTTTGALELAATLTNDVTGIGELEVDGSRVFVVATRGTTDDVKYTTDPTAGSISWTTLIALSSGDYVSGFRYMPTIGVGFNIIMGKIGGINGVWYMDTRTAAPWTLKEVVDRETADILKPFTISRTAAANFTTATSGGAATFPTSTDAWTNPSQGVGSDGLYATSNLSDNESTEYLKYTGWTGSGPAATDKITGLIIGIEHGVSTAARSYLYEIAIAVSGVKVGVSKHPRLAFAGTSDVIRYFGGITDDFFANLTGADLANIEVWIRYAGTATSAVVNVDNLTLAVAYSSDMPTLTQVREQTPATITQDPSFSYTTSWNNLPAIIDGDKTVGADGATETLVIGPLAARGVVPENAILKGFAMRMLIDGGTTTEELVAQFYQQGALIGINQAYLGVDHDDQPTYQLFGSADDDWKAGISAAAFPETYVAFQLTASSPTIYEVEFNYSYFVPGTMPVESIPAGGWMLNRNPAFPNRLTIISPVAEELTTVLKPREVWHLDLSYDALGNRPVVTLTQLNEGMAYVYDGVPHQGGWAIAGSDRSGMGVLVKFLDGAGNLLNFGFPGHDGTSKVRVNQMHTRGDRLLLDVVSLNASNAVTDRQWWLYKDGAWHPFTQSQSYTGANADALDIAAEPLAWGERVLNRRQDLIYSIFPNGTDTAVARQFIPLDFDQDPLLTDTDQVLAQSTVSSAEDTAASFDSVQWAQGPQEANLSLLTMQYLDRLVSATASTYGTVAVSISTDNGSNFTALNTFDSALEKYNSTGTKYQTIVYRWSLAHAAGTVKTPNALPWAMESDQQWPILRSWIVFAVANTLLPNPEGWFAAAKAYIDNTKSVGVLNMGTLTDPNGNPGVLTAIKHWAPAKPVRVPEGAAPAGESVDADLYQILFEERPGAAA